MKTLKVLVIGTALLLTTNIAFAQTIDDAAAKYGAAIEKVKTQDFKEAITLLKDAMNLGIDVGEEGVELVKEVQGLLPKIYMQCGVSALRQSNYDDAIKELLLCEEMADLYGDVQTMRQASRIISGAYQMQGTTAYNSKDYQKALESFSKGYTQDPSNIKLALLTAKSYAELGDLVVAMPIFQTVIEAGTSNSKFADDAAEAVKDRETYAAVAASKAAEAKELEQIVAIAELVPENAIVAMILVQTANNLKKYDVLTSRAEAAAALQADDAAKSDIYYLLGAAYNVNGNSAKAVEMLAKVTAGANVAAAKAMAAEIKK